MLSFQSLGSTSLRSTIAVMCLSLLTLAPTSIRSQTSGEMQPGIAWQVRGSWQLEGKAAPILTGDAIQPGSLLQPGEGTTNHSITVLLPDGQRILYECFTAEDCARGFRVPSLYRKPEPFAVDMLARVQAVLGRRRDDSSMRSKSQHAPRLPRDEELVVLGPGNRVHVQGLVEHLPDGRYTYDLRQLDHAYPRQSDLVLEKNAPSIDLALPSPGLYVITITDDLNTPRIDLFIAAIKPAQEKSFEKSFGAAKGQMEEWNEDYQGWPTHDLQRAYLESLMLGVKALTTDRTPSAAEQRPSSIGAGAGNTGEERAGVTAEPSFLPKPGVFDEDTAVALRCDSQDATIHYTVDGSQPVTSSPVYRAPIMVKGTELTIKSFASVAGKKDSPIVTGIFRIK